MSWTTVFQKFGHSVFIAYIELKIDGAWEPVTETRFSRNVIGLETKNYEVLKSQNGETCLVTVIEPDGLRRTLQVTTGGTIALHQNILSYHPAQVNEITVDEKAQAGKGRARDVL